MLNIEPLPIALDLEASIDMFKLERKAFTTGDTPVFLHTDGNTVSFVINDCFTELPPVDVKTYFYTGENGNECFNTYWIRLNLTAREFYEKMDAELQSIDEPPTEPGCKVYVNVLLQEDGFHVHIQTSKSTIYVAKH